MAFLRLRHKVWHIVYKDRGKQKSFTTGTDKKNLALGMLKSFNAQKTLKLPFEIYKPQEKIVLSVALEEFLSLRDNEKTRENYRQAFKRFTLLFDDKDASLYSNDDFVKFYGILKKEGLSPNTVANYSRHLSIIFNWLVEKKYVRDNPVPFVQPEHKEANPIPLERLGLVSMDLFKRSMFKQLDFIQLTFLCALRITETIHLQVDDFDMTNNLIYIRNEKGKRTDTIPMLEDIKNYLLQIDLPDGRIFDYAGRDSFKTWSRLLKKFDLNYSFHSLRKARGSQLANAGVEPLFLQKFMRHKKLETTMRFYVRIDLDKMRNGIDDKLRLS